MQKIRIHNDIEVQWTILTNGEATSLVDRELSLLLVDCFGNKIFPDFVISDNVLSFTFKGEDQVKNGLYKLILQDITSGVMRTIDECQAFELVPHSCMTGGNDDSDNLHVTTVSLTSSVVMGIKGDKGDKGDAAPLLVCQYSADATDWHDVFVDGDLYIRTSNDARETWSDAMRFVGASEWEEIKNKPSTFTPSEHTHEMSEIDGLDKALEDTKQLIEENEIVAAAALNDLNDRMPEPLNNLEIEELLN